LHDHQSILNFKEHNVVIPITVLEELDKFKKEENEKGRNARSVTRLIDELRLQGSLVNGVKLPNGGNFKILTTYAGEGSLNLDFTINDNKILSTASVLKLNINGDIASGPFEKVTLISNDINMRVRANIYGINVEPFGKKTKSENLYTGILDLEIEQPEYAFFKQNGHLPVSKLNYLTEKVSIIANQFVKIINKSDKNKFAYGTYIDSTKSIQKIRGSNEEVFGIVPKNAEQACALDALMDPDINLVTLIGKAGSGKTLIAIAAALEATL
jgi:PhoH-like ATPase